MFLDVLRRRNPDFIRAAQSPASSRADPRQLLRLDLDAVDRKRPPSARRGRPAGPEGLTP